MPSRPEEPVAPDLYCIRSGSLASRAAEACVAVIPNAPLQAVVHSLLHIVRGISAKSRLPVAVHRIAVLALRSKLTQCIAAFESPAR